MEVDSVSGLKFGHRSINFNVWENAEFYNCMSRYLMATLDQYVDMDYSLVYFHHGLTSR